MNHIGLNSAFGSLGKEYQQGPEVAPRKTVSSQLLSIDEELSQLLGAVDRMGERVAYVCESPQPENVMGVESTSIEPPAIDALDSIIGRIRLATARLHGLADRVRI